VSLSIALLVGISDYHNKTHTERGYQRYVNASHRLHKLQDLGVISYFVSVGLELGDKAVTWTETQDEVIGRRNTAN
jgi:hypothetical protein